MCQVNDSEFIHSNIGATTCMLETWQQVCGRPARESTPPYSGGSFTLPPAPALGMPALQYHPPLLVQHASTMS